jgi:uncharacterized protein
VAGKTRGKTVSVTIIALLAAAGSCLLVGIAIGATGIGGVLLVPALCVTAGLDPGSAIAVAMWSYMFTGVVAALIYGRRGQIDWRSAVLIAATSLPAALMGSLAIAGMSNDLIAIAVIAMLLNCAFSLLRPERASRATPGSSPRLSLRSLLGVGVITGFGSSVTGTGGPVIALPILHHLGMPLLAAVGIAQALQLPIATAASIGHLASGSVDPARATLIAVVVSAGVVCGALLAPSLPLRPFRILVGTLALLAAGALALGLG